MDNVDKQKLFSFIVNNNDLECLESKLNVFNPFDILKINNHEIRHSNVLAWLLNPRGNHEWGDFFLKKFLSEVILRNEELVDEKIDLMDIHLGNFHDAVVTREEKNIDILLVSHANQFVLLIENKIYAAESKHQLQKYLDYVNQEYYRYKILPVFLTQEGESPEHCETQYSVFSHESVCKLIKQTLKLRRKTLPSNITDFIDYYILTLERILGMKQDIVDLCQRIYIEHKDALDMIFETIDTSGSRLKAAFECFMKNHNDLNQDYLRNYCLWFSPKDFADKFPANIGTWVYPILFHFDQDGENKIKFHIEVGPFNVPEQRVSFMEFLEKQGYEIKPRSKEIGSQYTRIFTKKTKAKEIDWMDQETLLNDIENLYADDECQKEIAKIQNIIDKFKWNSN